MEAGDLHTNPESMAVKLHGFQLLVVVNVMCPLGLGYEVPRCLVRYYSGCVCESILG